MNNNKVLDITLNFEKIKEFAFLLKIFNLLEKLFSKQYLVANKKNN
jgi:hypothetical protein